MAKLYLPQQAKRLRIYIGESDRWRGKPLYAALLEELKRMNMAGATVVRGIAGFGAESQIHIASIVRLSEDLPLIVEVVDTPEKINEAIDVVYPMVQGGLITITDVEVIKYTHRLLNLLPADKPISEVMTHDVITLSPEMMVAEAWETMLSKLIKACPVVDSEQKVVGFLTDEDLLERAGVAERLSIAARTSPQVIREELEGLKSTSLKVKDVMSKPAITVNVHEAVGPTAGRMAKLGIKRLPVVDENGHILGVLSRLDVLNLVAITKRKPLPATILKEHLLTVSDVMTPTIPMVNQDDDLITIVDTILDTGSRKLVVVDDEGKAIGIISDSDVVNRIQPSRQKNIINALRRIGKPAPGKERAFDLMSPDVLSGPPDLSLLEAVRRMMTEGRKWLVVVDEQGKPLGLVDRQLLLREVASFYDQNSRSITREDEPHP